MTPDFEDVWTDVGGLRVHALGARGESSTETPIVFVPGLGVSAPSMLPTARLLTGERDVYAVSLPGHGLSERPRTPLDLRGYADVLMTWLAARGAERAMWVGHSFGSQVLVDLATTQPETIDRLTLMSLTVDPAARTLTSQLGRLLLDATREPLPLLLQLTRDYFTVGFRTMLRNGRLALQDDVVGKLRRLESPTLFVCGERDPLVPRRWAEEMPALAPDGTLAIIPGAPHAVQWVAPDAVASSIREFVSH